MKQSENAGPPSGGQGPESLADTQNDIQKDSTSKGDSPLESGGGSAAPGEVVSNASDGQSTAAFLDALFADNLGWIEIRIITERPKEDPGAKSKVVKRRFFQSVAELLGSLYELGLTAEHTRSGVFFGVLPRREKGKGKATDTADSRVVWADIDFKDFPGGEEAAMARLARFGCPPSIIVRSGNGVHCYWLLKETLPAAQLAELSKRLVRALGADHTFDAARLLRLPGTFNRKDADAPKLTVVERFRPELVYAADEIRNAAAVASELFAPGADSDARGDEQYEGADYSSLPPGEEEEGEDRPFRKDLPPRVLALISTNRRIRSLFHGEGKTEVGEQGKRVDCSSSGYDWSLTLALIRAGVQEPKNIVEALLARPDGGARRKGRSYAERTAMRAMEFAEKARQELLANALDFKVERVRIFDSTPPRFEFLIDDTTFVVSSAKLRSPSAFADAFLCALKRIPCLPGEREEWTPIVNELLLAAERVPMPPEASEEHALREAIERTIADLPAGDMPEDLQHGKVVLLGDGRRAFRCEAILQRLKDQGRDDSRQDVCRVLRELDYDSGTERITGVSVRVWRRNTATP